MHPVTVLLNVLGQLLVYRTLLSCSTRIVFAQMCILLYYWANKMMMMNATEYPISYVR